MEEQKLIKKVTEIGNGAHIFAPKEWINKEVIITLVPRLNIKKEVINLLYPYLDKISGVYLYGSYARNEQEKNSDVDIFVIVKEKFMIQKEGFDIIILEEKTIESALKINPILIYSIIKESKPIINSSFLENLKKIKIDKKNFKEFIESTKRIIRINKEMFKLDKETGSNTSDSIIYSLVLRLRGVFIINTLLENKKYSNQLFKQWILKNIPNIDYEKIYEVYKIIRDNKKEKNKIAIKDTESLMNLLEKNIEYFEKI